MKLLKSQIQTQKRKYHIYGLALNYLKVAQYQLHEKESLLRNQKEIIKDYGFGGNTANIPLNKFMKKTKSSPVIKSLSEVEQTIDACVNIKRLCQEAYDLGKSVRENPNKYDFKISDELYDFICLTNDTYPCYHRDDYEKIKIIYEMKKSS
jgi:hypothetical protein